jgi:hypothetical protein
MISGSSELHLAGEFEAGDAVADVPERGRAVLGSGFGARLMSSSSSTPGAASAAIGAVDGQDIRALPSSTR